MAFVLYSSRELMSRQDWGKEKQQEKQKEKRKTMQTQSMASLAALWSGFGRSQGQPSSPGVTKKKSTKKKSKAKSGLRRGSNLTSAEIVDSLFKSTDTVMPFIDSTESIDSHPEEPVTAWKRSRRPQSDIRSTAPQESRGRTFRSSLDLRRDGKWLRTKEDISTVFSPQDDKETVVSTGCMSQPMQPKICPPATRARSVSQHQKGSGKFNGEDSGGNRFSDKWNSSSSSISPVLSSFNNEIWPVYSEKIGNRSGGASRVSVVSPLSIDGSQSRRSYIPATATADRTPVSNLSRSTPRSRSTCESSGWTTGWSSRKSFTPGAASGYSSSFYSPMSQASRSAIVPGTPRERPPPLNHPDHRSYTLIDPKVAGVFDEGTSLRRIPTFRKKKSFDDSRRKPLPPAPEREEEDEESLPRALTDREAPVQPPLRATERSADCAEKPLFLPPNPLPSDLDSLDEAFRRSGLLFQTKNNPRVRRQEPPPPPQPPIQRRGQHQFIPWRPPTENGGARPSNLLLPTLVPCSTTSAPKPSATHVEMRSLQRSAPAQPLMGDGQENMKRPAHARRRTFDMDSLRELRAHAAERVNANLRNARKSMNGTATGADNPSPPLAMRPRNGPHNHMSNPALSEKVNRTLAFARSRRGAERNLRLRLPRLRTDGLAPPSLSEPKNLSIVVESPAELDGNSVRNTSASATTDQAETQSKSPVPPLEKVSEEVQPRPRSLVSTLMLEQIRNDSPTLRHTPAACEDQPDIPVSVAKSVILRIMESIDSLADLFNLAVINRGFYSVFKQHELPLLKSTLFRMSPAAWELREMSPPWEDDEIPLGNTDRPVPEYTAESYIRHYTRDFFTMIALKSLILVHCESFLRPDTTRALAGIDEIRSVEVDDAFWRVWTFCRIFGCGKGREEDIAAQADWLSGGKLAGCDSRGSSMILTHELGVNSVLLDPPLGFSQGNGQGLNSSQLHDMMEIWTCLGVLLQRFHGKCEEARKYGVFDNCPDIKPGDIAAETAALEGWTQYLLTLGPPAILTLISLNPSEPIETMFARAQSLGWTKWTSPTKASSGSSRLFLKEAISRAYEYHLVKHVGSSRSSRTPRTSHSSSVTSRTSSLGTSSHTSASDETNASRQRQAEFALELRKRKESFDLGQENVDISSLGVPISEERPLSTFQEVIQKLDGMIDGSSTPPPVPSTPSRQRTPSPSRNIQPLPSPRPQPLSIPLPRRHSTPAVEEKISQGRHPYPLDGHHKPPPPPIVDPVDIALNKMVKELGFNEEDAKWALKYTDTGESLDVEAAIDLLLQKEGNVAGLTRSKTTPAMDYESDLVWRPTWRWA